MRLSGDVPPAPLRPRAAADRSLFYRGLRWLSLGLFLVSGLAFLLVHNLSRAVLDPAGYHRTLDRLGVVEQRRAEVVRAGLLAALGLTRPASAAQDLPGLTPAAWDTIADELAPVDWFEPQIRGLVDDSFAWLETGAPLPESQADLGPVLDRLLTQAGALALLPLVSDLPDCEAGEQPLGQGVFTTCLPEGSSIQDLARLSARQLTEVLPRSASLPSLMALGLVAPETAQRLDQVRFAARWARQAAQFLGSLSLFFFAVYGLLTAGWGSTVDPRGLLRRLSLPLLAGGLAALLLAAGLAAAAQSGQLEPLWPAGARTLWPAPLFSDELRRAAQQHAGRDAALRAAAWGAGGLLLGAGLWGAGQLFSRGGRPVEQPGRVRKPLG